MTEGVKASRQAKLESNKTELEKSKATVAKAESHTAMLIKDECKKGKECENYQNNLNTLIINYKQA